jgi:hypothetical protein
MDNMSKVRHLVPGYVGFSPHLAKIENTVISASKHLKAQRVVERKLPVIDRIAIDSTYNRKNNDNDDVNANVEGDADTLSPLYMLYQCMNLKQRVKVAIRDRRR